MNTDQKSSVKNISSELYTPALRKILKLGEDFKKANINSCLSLIGLLLYKIFLIAPFLWIFFLGAINWTVAYFRLLNQKCPRCKNYYFGSVWLGSSPTAWYMHRVPDSKCLNCGLVLKKYI